MDESESVELSLDLTPPPGGLIITEDGDGNRTITCAGPAVPFGVVSGPSGDGRRYVFSGPPRNVDESIRAVRQHDREHPVGWIGTDAGDPWDVREDGMYTGVRVVRTTRGEDVLEDVRERLLNGFSIGAQAHKVQTDAKGVRTVTDWTAVHLGVVDEPAFSEAVGLTVSASSHSTGGTSVTTTTVDIATPPVVQFSPESVAGMTFSDMAEKVFELMDSRAEQARRSGVHPLSKFTREADWLNAVWLADRAGDKDAVADLMVAFAVPDQTTGDNPGVMAPGWRNDVKLNLDDARPMIAATGGALPLPDSGMEVDWPYLDPALDLDTLIQDQAGEKTPLQGVKIKILKGSNAIATAGVVSDISYQLLMRSSPSYQEAYMAIVRTAWARFTEAKFELALVAGATATDDYPAFAVTEAARAAWAGYLFAQSSKIRKATGRPLSVVGAASDVFIALGSMGFVAPSGNPQNSQGTSDPSTLEIRIGNLVITEAPFLADGDVIFTNGTAARFAEAGPFVASAEAPEKLGRDIALWGMYSDAEIYFPGGVLLGQAGI